MLPAITKFLPALVNVCRFYASSSLKTPKNFPGSYWSETKRKVVSDTYTMVEGELTLITVTAPDQEWWKNPEGFKRDLSGKNAKYAKYESVGE